MSRRTLYIHIGAHRTATSAIQKFLFVNCDKLLERGYLQVDRAQRHMKLMQEMSAGRRDVNGVAQSIRDQIAASGHEIHSAIITDEDICCKRNLSYLLPFRDHFDVKIIYTLRRQDLWLESWYYQNVKWQWQLRYAHLSFPEFMQRSEDFHWIHYNRYISHLEKLFGAENLRLTVHENSQMPGGPIATFCRHLGLDDLTGFTTSGRVNESFSPLMSEYMRQLPLDQAPPVLRSELIRILRGLDHKLHSNMDKVPSLLLDLPARTALMAGYAQGNRAVAQRHFGRDTLFAEPLPPANAPMADLRLPSDPQKLMADLVAPLVSELIGKWPRGPGGRPLKATDS